MGANRKINSAFRPPPSGPAVATHSRDRLVPFGWRAQGLCEGGEDFGFGDAVAEGGEGFSGEFLGIVDLQEFVNEEVDFRGDDFAFQQVVETAVFAEASADEGVVGVNHLAVDLGAGAAEADVGDLMLSATGWAAGEVDADFVLVPAAVGFELIDQCDHAVLGLGDGEIAEFDAGAGDAAFAEV